MSNVLVAGGGGFIGRRIVSALLEQGHAVRIADIQSLDHIKTVIPGFKDIDYRQGSITDWNFISDACSGIDVVFNFSYIQFSISLDGGSGISDPNIPAILCLLNAAANQNCKRLIHASSCSVYGLDIPIPTPETYPLQPINIYSASKAAAEIYVSTYCRQSALDACNLRFFNVYGPEQRTFGGRLQLLPAIYHAIESNTPLTVYNHGEMIRDFIHIDDIAEASLLAMNASDPLNGISLNIGTGIETSVRDFVDIVCHSKNATPIINNVPGNVDPTIDKSCADIALAERVLGFQPKVTLNSAFEGSN